MHLMTDSCLRSLCCQNPANQRSLNVPSAPASHRSASCNKMCVFVCPARVSRIILVGNVARIAENRNVSMVLVEKPEGKCLLGRPWSRMVDNIETDIGRKKSTWVGLNWFRMGTSGRLL